LLKPFKQHRTARISRFEVCEPRLLMAAEPLAELSVNYLAKQSEHGLSTQAAAGNRLMGLTQVRNEYGFSGSGQTVVVIDTGIAYDHEALGGGFGQDYRVVGGRDFTEENDSNPYDDGPYGSHGTHVAGIIGGSSATYKGVAPGVDLVGLRVFNDAGTSYFNWIEKALRWVHQHRNDFDNPVTTVNLSIGTEWNSTNVPNWSKLEDDFARLKKDGIFISVAAGNSFTNYNRPGLSYPAASEYVVPVSSVDSSGKLSYFSQRHNRAIAAVGAEIVSAVPDYRGNQNGQADDYLSYSGTSMAAPFVAGASVLIREAYAFIGRTNVNQNLINRLMRNTADTIRDSVTGKNYLRLNLDRALDSIMPEDEFGSTMSKAHSLGTIGGSESLSGSINTLKDQDFFKFTAKRSGTITFSADTAGMDPQWSLGGLQSGRGEKFSFEVTAGQRYTVGLSSSEGVGNYSLNLAVDTTGQTDWGVIDFQEFDGQRINSSNRQFAITAAQNGYLTIEAFFAHASGNVNLELYNSAGKLVDSSAGSGNAERLNVQAEKGERFTLRLTGSNSDVDLRVTNLVSRQGDTVRVSGTSGEDIFEFRAGATHRISINGASYTFNSSAIQEITFAAKGGQDSATLIGSGADDTAWLWAGSATLYGSGYQVSATSVADVSIDGGTGFDSAFLYDSAGNDLLTVKVGETRFSGATFDNVALNFEQVQAYSFGGSDQAELYESNGSNHLEDFWSYGFDQLELYLDDEAGSNEAEVDSLFSQGWDWS
jgi:hypothetical protein